jgi:hypothetical protein
MRAHELTIAKKCPQIIQNATEQQAKSSAAVKVTFFKDI